MMAQEEFWNWFIAHEPELFDFDPNQVAERERIFGELQGELQKVDPDLTFEFGPNEPRREFVISAGGIKRAFPAVVSLVDAVPALGRWKVIAFRPRRPVNIVEFQGKRIDPHEVQFSLLDNGKIPGIYLFIPGFREKVLRCNKLATCYSTRLWASMTWSPESVSSKCFRHKRGRLESATH